jgi:hypothetical protein
MTMTEKSGPEFPKQTALKRLYKEIGKHLVRGTVDDKNASDSKRSCIKK